MPPPTPPTPNIVANGHSELSAARPTVYSREGVSLPRAQATIDRLIDEFGTEYTGKLILALEASNNDDQAGFAQGLDLALAELIRAGRGNAESRSIAIEHVKAVNAAVGEDFQAYVDDGGEAAERRQPDETG
ncbi:hypothetical protein OG225_42580 (plasmid) [Nocardia sp. NBC_01377]|uniref:hypothetical protein n=1 Tax=Nocardia sp. NBC_01377 TaxID=2903595 RepID=UPI002F908E59